jgi:hypothetical protein
MWKTNSHEGILSLQMNAEDIYKIWVSPHVGCNTLVFFYKYGYYSQKNSQKYYYVPKNSKK